MKITFLHLAFTLMVLYSCQTQPKKESKIILKPLSSWMINNEDSMASFIHTSLTSIGADEGDNKITYSEYKFSSGLFDSLQNELNKHDTFIKVYIGYRPFAIKQKYDLILTHDYYKHSTDYLDSVFSDIDSLKHFRIVKYRPAGGMFSKYINGKDTIKPNEIRFAIKLYKTIFDVTFFTTKKITKETVDEITKGIFGEEIMAKMINKMDYQILKDTTISTLSISEIKKFFQVK